jgi:hypothetical protein
MHYANIVSQQTVKHETTQSIRDAILERDRLSRMPIEELLTHEVVDTNEVASKQAVAAGYPRLTANWVCYFMYRGYIRKVWTTERGQIYHWEMKKTGVQ